jgi:hypothetical protein
MVKYFHSLFKQSKDKYRFLKDDALIKLLQQNCSVYLTFFLHIKNN